MHPAGIFRDIAPIEQAICDDGSGA